MLDKSPLTRKLHAAYREAGYAVVAIVERWPLKWATISPGVDQNAVDRILRVDWTAIYQRSREDPAPYAGTGFRKFMRLCHAGSAAEHAASGGYYDMGAHRESTARIERVNNEIGVPRLDYGVAEREEWWNARALVEQHSRAIRTVASMLMARTDLTGDETRRVVRDEWPAATAVAAAASPAQTG